MNFFYGLWLVEQPAFSCELGFVPFGVEEVFDDKAQGPVLDGIVDIHIGYEIAFGGDGIILIGRSVLDIAIADTA